MAVNDSTCKYYRHCEKKHLKWRSQINEGGEMIKCFNELRE